jgi:hypothetical protein
MNRNRNQIITFSINNKFDHFIGEEKHIQPHQRKRFATKKKLKK